jgi:hypothetical protein
LLLSFVFTVWRLWFSNSSEHLGCMLSIYCTCIEKILHKVRTI